MISTLLKNNSIKTNNKITHTKITNNKNDVPVNYMILTPNSQIPSNRISPCECAINVSTSVKEAVLAWSNPISPIHWIRFVIRCKVALIRMFMNIMQLLLLAVQGCYRSHIRAPLPIFWVWIIKGARPMCKADRMMD